MNVGFLYCRCRRRPLHSLRCCVASSCQRSLLRRWSSSNSPDRSDDDSAPIIHGTIPNFGEGIMVGQYAETRRTFTTEQVTKYGDLIQDKNILHNPMILQDLLQEHPYLQTNFDAGLIKLDDDDERSGDNCGDNVGGTTLDTKTTKPLVHGMMVSSIFSSIFATLSPGCVYMNQTLNFVSPLFANELVKGRITIEKVRKWRRNAGVVVQCDTQVLRLSCSPSNDDNNNNENDDDHNYAIVIKGNAKVWLPSGYMGTSQ